MQRNIVEMIAAGSFALTLILGATRLTQAEEAKAPYPSMAPMEKYLMGRDAEIALARSAAPAAVSAQAEVLVLGQKGYGTAVKGTNGFVCIVERSWAQGFDEPEFWNPKMRAPICFNLPAARSVLPPYLERTKMVLSGESKTQVKDSIEAAFDKQQLSTPAPGSMCYMMSSHAYLNDSAGRWHSHLMFFLPTTDGAAWGAGLPGSPLLVAQDPFNHLTVFMLLVGKWSDGTPASTD